MSQHPVSLLILNGKNTDNDVLRNAVQQYREDGFTLHVRVTWEHGDAKRYVEEAVQLTVDTVIAAGGDGTINEVASALVQCAPAQRLGSFHSAPRMILPPVARSRLMSNMH